MEDKSGDPEAGGCQASPCPPATPELALPDVRRQPPTPQGGRGSGQRGGHGGGGGAGGGWGGRSY